MVENISKEGEKLQEKSIEKEEQELLVERFFGKLRSMTKEEHFLFFNEI